MALACKKLTGLLLLPAQGSDVSTREARASESASATRIDALEILASSWAEVSLPRKIAGGALRGIILWQQLALPLAGLKVSRIILLMFNGRGPSAAGSQWIGASCWSLMERRSFSWQGIAAELPGWPETEGGSLGWHALDNVDGT